MENNKIRHVFIIGSKGIPANYGGFETFVENLTLRKKAKKIKYHVACLTDDEIENFEYNGAECFNIKAKKIGSAKAIFYDLDALKHSINFIKKNNIQKAIIYILACRIGPFIGHYKKKMKKLGITLLVNPDGHEWKREKWNRFIKKYWKISEKLMIKHADKAICDSKNIEKYILQDYKKYNPKTQFIAYGSEVSDVNEADYEDKLNKWMDEKKLIRNEYYLIVGRFVPENNYETMIKEFMKSKTSKDLVIITNTQCKFFNKLKMLTNFDSDKRIKFVGTVYDKELLIGIRKNAFAYLHGHEVGGTNPSLLEALSLTNLNLVLGVGFNREVAEKGAQYWTKSEGDLANIIDNADKMKEEEILQYGSLAKERINKYYSWKRIVEKYEKLFLE